MLIHRRLLLRIVIVVTSRSRSERFVSRSGSRIAQAIRLLSCPGFCIGSRRLDRRQARRLEHDAVAQLSAIRYARGGVVEQA